MFRNLDNIFTDLNILHVNLAICSAKHIFSSIAMPKYFTYLLTETGLLLKSILIVKIEMVILGGNINVEDFLQLTAILLPQSLTSFVVDSWEIITISTGI